MEPEVERSDTEEKQSSVTHEKEHTTFKSVELPSDLQEKISKYEQILHKCIDNNKKFSTLMKWGQILTKYAKQGLKKFVKSPSTGAVENHLKECLFTACAKFQDANDLELNSEEQIKLLEGWGDTLLAISIHFRVPFFEFATEKYDQALVLSPNSPELLCKLGNALSSQANFSELTSFGLTKDDLLNLADEKFTKAQELDPNNFKTLIRWARSLESNSKLKRVFLEAAEYASEIGAKYTRALEIDPTQSWCLDSWGRHLDSLVLLFSSCRKRSEHEKALVEVMNQYFLIFKKIATKMVVSLNPIMAFSLLEDTKVSDMAIDLLKSLCDTSECKEVCAEAQHHMSFVNTINSTKLETRKMNMKRAKETFLCFPESAKRLLEKSGITVEEAGENFDLFMNSFYFLVDKDAGKHAVFKRCRLGGYGTKSSTKHKFTELELNEIFKRENPNLFYTDKTFIGKG
eukprot:TRINITY_DN974_c0_g1_i5.p1 TRINITY_DN974_c0_g1~~TRINITY_DN974_c0_g1_i5.p1  ORF type:complete len:459 (+),score=50.76 TRINITY_DN974_c0_g1_i5:23-1399(+)